MADTSVDPGIDVVDVDPSDPVALATAGALRYRWWLEEGGEGELDEGAFTERFGRYLLARADTHRGVLVRDGERVVGVGWIVLVDRLPWPDDPHPRAGLLQAVYVDAAHRGAGAGTHLITALLEIGRSEGLKYVLVNPTDRAESLYRRLGFAGAEPPLRLELRA